jgi:hypothetical protein
MKFSISNSSKRVLMLFVLMIIGFYLAISAIITLSYIGDAQQSKVPIVFRFDSTFKAINETSTANSSRSYNLDSFSVDIWSKYETLRASTRGILAMPNVETSVKKNLNRSFDSINTVLIRHLKLLNDERAQSIRHIDLYRRQLKNAATKVNVDFKGNISSLPSGILSRYAEDLTNYLIQLPYEDYINDSYNRFASNHAVLSQAIVGCIKTIDVLNSQLKGGPQNDTIPGATLSLPLLPADADYSPLLTGATSDIIAEPKPNKIGSDYGAVFSLFIQGIGQGSTDVLLLVGMIGFGLFGSILSIFITTNIESDNEKSLTYKTMLVVVKGFSAAIVVFLATRGGISILNSGSSNPNPLILFLFCFIGAIFSDPIWEWSKQKIVNTFPKTAEDETRANDIANVNAGKEKLLNPEVLIPNPDLTESANKPK